MHTSGSITGRAWNKCCALERHLHCIVCSVLVLNALVQVSVAGCQPLLKLLLQVPLDCSSMAPVTDCICRQSWPPYFFNTPKAWSCSGPCALLCRTVHACTTLRIWSSCQAHKRKRPEGKCAQGAPYIGNPWCKAQIAWINVSVGQAAHQGWRLSAAPAGCPGKRACCA